MRALRRGIGLCIDDPLMSTYRSHVMRLAMQGRLAVVFSDYSLAFGVNMPFRTCVFNGNAGGLLTPLMAQQMSGRAGRRGLDTQAHLIFTQINFPFVQQIMMAQIPAIEGRKSPKYDTQHAQELLCLQHVYGNLSHIDRVGTEFKLVKQVNSIEKLSAMLGGTSLAEFVATGEFERNGAEFRDRSISILRSLDFITNDHDESTLKEILMIGTAPHFRPYFRKDFMNFDAFKRFLEERIPQLEGVTRDDEASRYSQFFKDAIRFAAVRAGLYHKKLSMIDYDIFRCILIPGIAKGLNISVHNLVMYLIDQENRPSARDSAISMMVTLYLIHIYICCLFNFFNLQWELRRNVPESMVLASLLPSLVRIFEGDKRTFIVPLVQLKLIFLVLLIVRRKSFVAAPHRCGNCFENGHGGCGWCKPLEEHRCVAHETELYLFKTKFAQDFGDLKNQVDGFAPKADIVGLEMCPTGLDGKLFECLQADPAFLSTLNLEERYNIKQDMYELARVLAVIYNSLCPDSNPDIANFSLLVKHCHGLVIERCRRMLFSLYAERK